jgi:hypothetical protein
MVADQPIDFFIGYSPADERSATWLAVSPDGALLASKIDGQFRHARGTCRFELGELDEHVPQVRRIATEAPF